MQTLTVVGCQVARRGDAIDGAMASRNRNTPPEPRPYGQSTREERVQMRKTFAAVVVVGLAFMTAGALCASGQDGEIEGYFEMVGEELLVLRHD